MDDERYQKLKDYALKLLSFRPRSIKELSGRLIQYSIKKGIQKKNTDRLIRELLEKNLLNDEEFASWWIGQRLSTRPKGRRIIKLELKEKGIDNEVIDSLLSGDDNLKENEFKSALNLALKKKSKLRNYSDRDVKMRIGNYLLRRGFTWDTVNKVIDSTAQKA